MKYRNKKTGQIIDVASQIGGSNWELIDGKAPEKEPAVVPASESAEPVKKTVKKTTKKTTKK